MTFCEVVFEVMRHLEGAYALIFKSWHYPNELVACKRGSPLLLGVKVSYFQPHDSVSFLTFFHPQKQNISEFFHYLSNCDIFHFCYVGARSRQEQ